MGAVVRAFEHYSQMVSPALSVHEIPIVMVKGSFITSH